MLLGGCRQHHGAPNEVVHPVHPKMAMLENDETALERFGTILLPNVMWVPSILDPFSIRGSSDGSDAQCG